jgi:(2Fe-2S) ferredoxin
VVYPEGVWYTYVDQEDLEEIIQEHLVHGRVVERLQAQVRAGPGGGLTRLLPDFQGVIAPG